MLRTLCSFARVESHIYSECQMITGQMSFFTSVQDIGPVNISMFYSDSLFIYMILVCCEIFSGLVVSKFLI